jgi:hypothetical protein
MCHKIKLAGNLPASKLVGGLPSGERAFKSFLRIAKRIKQYAIAYSFSLTRVLGVSGGVGWCWGCF